MPPFQVVASRNVMMAPGMLLMPLALRAMEKKHWFKNKTYLHMPFQVRVCISPETVWNVCRN
jgi:hypothetical protein